MNIKKLIKAVFERQLLWDHTHPCYHMRDFQKKLWIEVAIEVESTVDEVKKKWRGLRDTFRKEFRKSQMGLTGDGSESPKMPTWPHFKHLLFLSDTILPSLVEGHLLDVGVETVMESDESEDTPDNSRLSFDDGRPRLNRREVVNLGRNDQLNHLNGALHRRRQLHKRSFIEDKMVELEEKKLKLFEVSTQLSNDSDYQFLISLLPYMKALPPSNKLVVRSQLQQIFIDAQKKTEEIPVSNEFPKSEVKEELSTSAESSSEKYN